ncbi:uncharacterized protein Z518_06926 [Rhinocladiella mackenziei CBS 650.93]|uniref:UBC core domain-containing protein n=1 Tax=Rhinocladiella mackenziei CBS 650.93 TaxID=1442369 RepID=A0A0D2IC33_9EURO|nr:uncharacterized protein Z518_06926 [Rhinocladiella mackenziei CBS 650.93]KIX03374.1 hypothetical protein Z518_06926 [Rhinocladiella mackenziei CBS 650.93]
MRTLQLYDHVCLKNDPSLYGSVQRTNSDAFDPLEDELIIAHTEVPQKEINEFLLTGVPPVGYVYVQFSDEAAGCAVVSEDDLTLLSRSFQIGDNVKQDANPMTGEVIDVSESYILEPISLKREIAHLSSTNAPTFPPCSSECSPSLPPHFSHPNPHALIYNVPSREVKRAQDVLKDDYIIYRDWVGLVDDVEYDVVIALENKSVVVVTNTNGLYIPLPDYRERIVWLPESDGFKRPDRVGALQGWPNTTSVQEPRPGDFVIVERNRLRNGRWLRGSHDPNSPAQGVVVDVRAREVSVDWVSSSLTGEGQPASPLLPSYDLPIYENIRDFRDPASLRRNKDVIVYDLGKMPIKNSALDRDGAGNGRRAYKEADNTQDICPGQDLSIGMHVKFRDPTAAAVKYQGSEETSHGQFVRLATEDFGGWDLNEFKIVFIEQEATVLWQDGTVTTTKSTLLKGYALFEAELAPADIVLKREGMRQRSAGTRKGGSSAVKDFDEMAFFERPHDLLPQNVGVVQTVDPKERVARVRWYKEPKVEIRAVGQILNPESRFGPIGDVVEEVSLYEIMSFPSLMRRRRDMCIVAPPGEFPKPLNAPKTQNHSHSTRSTDSTPTRGGGLSMSIPPRVALARGSRLYSERSADQGARSERQMDWIGEIVAMGLDGSVTVRLGGSQPCRDICIDSDSILAIIDDRELADIGDDMMDVDSWSDEETNWSDDDGPEPVFESVEYEGGQRLDDDSGDENWVSDEDQEFADAEEEWGQDDEDDQDDNNDAPMAGVAIQENQISTAAQPQRSLVQLRTMLGSEEPPQFLVLDREPPADQFGLHSTSTPSASLKRISREHRILATALPEGEIYVRTYESRLDLLRCLIIGPKDTPYENAPFLVDLSLPEGFPDEPPTAHFHSWTSGLGRINPNLYEDGKICLSLLGTWTGKKETERWSEKATILQVLVSLQGLVFVKRPFYNEAGFEGYEQDQAFMQESEQYSEKAFVMARGFVKYALLRPPGGLEDVLAWLYLPHDASDPMNSLLGRVIQRGRQLIQKSEEARLSQDESLLDSTGGKDNDTQVFLKPLSRGASIMLNRMIGELQTQLDRVSPRCGNG